jgi:hypothetical protein
MSCSSCLVLWLQLAANLALFSCANVVGGHHRRLTDTAHKQTFSHVRSYIESRIRLEHQSQQQVSYIVWTFKKLATLENVRIDLQLARFMETTEIRNKNRNDTKGGEHEKQCEMEEI